MGHCNGSQWTAFISLTLLLLCSILTIVSARARGNENLTACQHLRSAESRRAKALAPVTTHRVRIPRCTAIGEFESIQCSDETNGTDCWCVDSYGVELAETRKDRRENVNCTEIPECVSVNCRMFCPSGFARDISSGCPVCKCRDPCDGIECPKGQACQPQEVKCKNEPCPPIPSCKRPRSFLNFCPAGQPLTIEGNIRPFLCGLDDGKPQCPPLYECIVESGNDYGVCCPNSVRYEKPGVCPKVDQSEVGYGCGASCSHDLECNHMDKCCYSAECKLNCQSPINVTTCHQARALSEILAVSEREGRGYVPDCNGPGGMFAPKQCSRNGLVCWCVDIRTGHKMKDTMGSAQTVSCDAVENMIPRGSARSVSMDQCDTNICAAVCEYGFKIDHNNCPTCECSEPCEGFRCPSGSHCEVATDPLCESDSALCASVPLCKPDLPYSNPCDFGTPLTDNITGEVFYCLDEEVHSRASFAKSFFDEDEREGRAMSNKITCPERYVCTKLHRESTKVCCAQAEEETTNVPAEVRPQTMCEYLRDFSERMEGTEVGMQLAIRPPTCEADGSYKSRQCIKKKVTVTKSDRKRILEEKTIREMKQLLFRSKRDTSDRLHLYPVDAFVVNAEFEQSQGRSAKLISSGSRNYQSLYSDEKKLPNMVTGSSEKTMVEVEIDECWCVDGFGTEIPGSRGTNVTDESCSELKTSLDCLDLTCRMGCEYGFVIDSMTQCPVCSCRDPCDGVSCPDRNECRIVEVSCEGEYCPPVPACLPQKPGQCPFLVPPGSNKTEANYCNYECRSDFHCEGKKRCCSNGCGTQCVEPQMKTACEHLRAIQMHQASELGIPAKQLYIAQCDSETGKWNDIQCGVNGTCWCVDNRGQEISGTRTKDGVPICELNSAYDCPTVQCGECETGYNNDENGCQICDCRDFCNEISCSGGEECQLVSVECVSNPCPKMPICVPRRESLCPEGSPLQQNGKDLACGPRNLDESCPTTHSCQLDPMTNTGVCCAKTRDVCFDSIDSNCLAKDSNDVGYTKWRFSPNLNKCVPVAISAGTSCQSKNIFNSEFACKSVCPALSACERLKLKNNLFAKKTGHMGSWFQPRCDPVTGHWSPVQCLGSQPDNSLESGRAFNTGNSNSTTQPSVCWCADKRGAPMKGTLTRDLEPICNHRQARRRMEAREDNIDNPLLEELVRQLTLLADDKENDIFAEIEDTTISVKLTPTESQRSRESKNLNTESTLDLATVSHLIKTVTRCQSLSKSATYPVACGQDGSFVPTQCNGDQCWCVDAAGNQLPSTSTFKIATKQCHYVPVVSISVDLYLTVKSGMIIQNLYEVIRTELTQLLGPIVENLRVQENSDNSVLLKFELHNDEKIDTAFAVEEMIKRGDLVLGNGYLKPDITLSRIVHNIQQTPEPQTKVGISESTFQTIVFVLATSSAFLVSIFVVFIMLKRGKKKTAAAYPDNRVLASKGDKFLDYSSPIFVLNGGEDGEKLGYERKSESKS